MSHRIYEQLNDADLDLTVYNENAEVLSPLEKKRIQRAILKTARRNSRRTKRAIAAATVLVLSLSFGTVFRSDVYAFVKALQYKLEMFVASANLAPYIQVLDTTISHNNVSVTLNEVVMDSDELVVTSTISIADSEVKNKWMHHSDDLIIDGKLINSGGSGASMQVAENTFEFYMVYDISGYDINPEEAHNIIYTVKNIICAEQDVYTEIPGKWEFKFSAEGSELLADTLSVPFNDTILLPDGNSIILTKYTSNSLGQKIYFDITPFRGLEYFVELRGTDDKGRDVVFYISRSGLTSGIFKVEPINNGYIQEDAETLTLVPYYVENPKQSGRMNNNYLPLDMVITISLK